LRVNPLYFPRRAVHGLRCELGRIEWRNLRPGQGRTRSSHPRGRSKARVLTAVLIAVVVLLAGGGVAVARWAPWRPIPPQRPAGVTVSNATFNSITIGWSEPDTGPVPAGYQIFENGRLVNSAGRTARSYLDAGLTPGSSYSFQVVAILGKLRSPKSAPLRVSTKVLRRSMPRCSAARLLWATPRSSRRT
jgi:Fibronectin type III domain